MLVKVRPFPTRYKTIFENNSYDKVFDELTKNVFGNFSPTTKTFQQPAINVLETNDGFNIELAAPGLSKADFNITVEKDILNISAKKEKTLEEGEKYTRKEFSYFEFKRSFRLPETIDTNSIKASFNNGILKLDLGKVEAAKVQASRQIEVG